MDVANLDATHPTYAAPLWGKYDALYRGGEAFREAIEEFLPKNPQEPGDVYTSRKAESHYCGYVGPIIDFFAAMLMASPLVVRAKDRQRLDATGPDTPDFVTDSWYAKWHQDVDGAGTELTDFLRGRFTSACIKGRSWWLVECPDDGGDAAASRAEWEKRGLGDAFVTPLDNEQVTDWEVDERGELDWAIVHTYETRRPAIESTRSRVRETWRAYDRTHVRAWAIEYDTSKGEQRPKVAVALPPKLHGFRRVPLVRLGFAGTAGVRVRVGSRWLKLSSSALEGLWLMQRLADAQIAHFRTSSALDWNIKRTCYAMPVFRIASEDKPPTMGAGYYIQIGTDEEATWIAPPTEHLATVGARISTLKDEIYRVANQMAQGVDNNAAAVGRSGDSKLADAQSTEVLLSVYGAIVRDAAEQTYELLSDVRGDSDRVAWSVEGLDSFSLVDANALAAAAVAASNMDGDSKTLRRELSCRLADALLPGIEQGTRDTIRREISESFEQTDEPEPARPALGGDDTKDDVDALHLDHADEARHITLPTSQLDRVRVAKLGALGGFTVWAVDGNAVRLLDPKFGLAANPARTAYVPAAELWVDQRVAQSPPDLAVVALHGVIEATVMAGGACHEHADAAAHAMDDLLRKALATGAASASTTEEALATAKEWLPGLLSAATGLAAAQPACAHVIAAGDPSAPPEGSEAPSGNASSSATPARAAKATGAPLAPKVSRKQAAPSLPARSR